MSVTKHVKLFDPTKPCRTRDGRKAIILTTDQTKMEGPYSYPIRAKVQHPDNGRSDEWVEWNFMANGQWKSNDSHNHNDLVNEMPWHVILAKKMGWAV
jgi:hypothetical protein